MLTELRVTGIAIAEEVAIRFGPGLNVVTGETGAGKSILLHALHLVLGGRMAGDALRDGVEEAVVEALFDLAPGHPALERLAAAGLPVEPGGGEVLVRRVASRSGRGRVFVNGSLCTLSMLEGCLRGLVDVTDQHEHVSLLDEATHLPLLDAFAGLGVRAADTLGRYRAARATLLGALAERERLLRAHADRAARREASLATLEELDAARLAPGEDAALERERQVLASAERLRGAAREAEALVYADEGSSAEGIGRALRALGEAASLDARLAPAVASLRTAGAEIEEAGRALSRYAESLAADPERLAAVEERLALVRSLARKHGGSIEAALARGEEARAELEALDGAGERLIAIEAEVAQASAALVELARELTRARTAAAEQLEREARAGLDALAMTRSRLEVTFAPPPDAVACCGVALGADGAERVRLLMSANAGEPARPLSRVASGGELSRIVLALKRALARIDPVDTYVLDEVDAGIGGAVAEAVGRLLSDVSRDRQVVCVTHLPQVAAFADRHVRVEKRTRGGRTVTRAAQLETSAERRAEIARMLAGMDVTESALEHAAALMVAASRARQPRAPREGGRRTAPARTAARTVRRHSLTRRVGG